jgi:hypothetical protein
VAHGEHAQSAKLLGRVEHDGREPGDDVEKLFFFVANDLVKSYG